MTLPLDLFTTLKATESTTAKYTFATAARLTRPSVAPIGHDKTERPTSLDVLERRVLDGDKQAAEALLARVKIAVRKAGRDSLGRRLEWYLVKVIVASKYGAANDPLAVRSRHLPQPTSKTVRQWAKLIFEYAAHEGEDLSQITRGYGQQKFRARKRVKEKRLKDLEERYRNEHNSRNLSADEEAEIQRRRNAIKEMAISRSDRERGAIDAITSKLKTIFTSLRRRSQSMD